MKKLYTLRILALSIFALVLLSPLTSCDDNDAWAPVPPYGWNTFFDNRLNGTWQLVQANGRPVTGYDVNYMDFYGNGRGRYYYYSGGRPDSEQMAYWCQVSDNSNSNYQMNIQYEYGSPSTVNYWFTDRGAHLWMQWQSGAGVITYVYEAVAGPGW